MYANIRRLLAAADTPVTSGVVSLDVELFIRLLEWAREEVKEDVPLHVAAERLASVCQGGKTATMSDYADVVPADSAQTDPSPVTASVGDTSLLKIEFRGDFDWRGFVSALATLGSWGSSRKVVVAPEDPDIQRQFKDKGIDTEFYYDGDGADKVFSAELNGRDFWPPKERPE